MQKSYCVFSSNSQCAIFFNAVSTQVNAKNSAKVTSRGYNRLAFCEAKCAEGHVPSRYRDLSQNLRELTITPLRQTLATSNGHEKKRENSLFTLVRSLLVWVIILQHYSCLKL